jgi:hypothetical protein
MAFNCKNMEYMSAYSDVISCSVIEIMGTGWGQI